MMSKLYLRYLRFARAINILKKDSHLIDSTALQLLNEIAVQHFDGKTLTVSQAIALNKIASPATLHRKLDELREAGLIQQIFEGKNRRTKYLVPTKAADAYFAKMSKAITSAVNA
jgi:DNA-binding MarR family transcriptional regulator